MGGRRLRWTGVLMVMGVAACAAPKAKQPAAGVAADRVSPFFEKTRVVAADGTVKEVGGEEVSAFEGLMRSRLPRVKVAEKLVARTGKQQVAVRAAAAEVGGVKDVFTLEADVAEGVGNEGAYMAVVDRGGEGELMYFEQLGHLPRGDRYFWRKLTGEEVAGMAAFYRARALDTLVETAGAATQPSTRPGDGGGGGGRVMFRLARGVPEGAGTAAVVGPGRLSAGATELVLRFARLRDVAGMECRYFQPIPQEARVLYADPRRRAVEVGADKEAVFVRVVPPLEVEPGKGRGAEGAWYVRRELKWVKAERGPVKAVLAPIEFNAAGSPVQVPREERWLANPGERMTTVWHYLPFGLGNGEWRGFVVPGLVFEDGAFAVVGETLYLIEEGVVISVPIPAAALGGRGVK